MKENTTSLYDAAGQGDLGAVKAFLARGVAVDSSPNQYCGTPLVDAARNGHLAVVELLLARGADINGNNFIAPFQAAIEGKQANTALCLLTKGANWSERGLLERAITNGLPEVAEALIQRGAAAGAEEARAALMLAASNGQVGVVDCLLAKGAAVNAKNQQGETALHRAASAGKLDVVKKLLSAGADVSAVGDHLRTALHLAASEGRHEVARTLLDGGAAVDARDVLGATPLHQAVHRMNVSATQVLMYFGADPGIPDFFGNTIRQRAGGQVELLGLLRQSGAPGARAAGHAANLDQEADAEEDRGRAISHVVTRVTEIIVEVAGGISPTEILPTTNFVADLNFDSLGTVELVMELEDEFAVSIPDEEADEMRTAGDMVDFVLRKLLPSSLQQPKPVFAS